MAIPNQRNGTDTAKSRRNIAGVIDEPTCIRRQ